MGPEGIFPLSLQRDYVKKSVDSACHYATPASLTFGDL